MISYQADIKVAIFRCVDGVLQLAAGYYEGQGPLVLVKINADSARAVRSHFERLITTEQADTLIAALPTIRGQKRQVDTGEDNEILKGLGDPLLPDDQHSEAPEISDSESESCNSDVDDVFHLKECSADKLPEDYARCDRMQWLSAVREVASLLRDDVTLPLKPKSQLEVFSDVDSGVRLPTWHCAFQGCSSCSANTVTQQNHERGVWSHIWRTKQHYEDLTRVLQKYKLSDSGVSQQMISFTLYSAALAEKERLCVPLVGASIDRRSLLHVGEVLNDDAIHVLICFICGCKHIQHTGYNFFGDVTEKGTIRLHITSTEPLGYPSFIS